ncbi:U2 small nuclear ribonucleoprotein A' [Linum perenne]
MPPVRRRRPNSSPTDQGFKPSPDGGIAMSSKPRRLTLCLRNGHASRSPTQCAMSRISQNPPLPLLAALERWLSLPHHFLQQADPIATNISGRCICGWGREEEEVAKGGMVRLTADLIWNSPHFFNAIKERELDIRGNKIPVIENLGATELLQAMEDDSWTGYRGRLINERWGGREEGDQKGIIGD